MAWTTDISEDENNRRQDHINTPWTSLGQGLVWSLERERGGRERVATQNKAGVDVETEAGLKPWDMPGAWRSERRFQRQRRALEGSTVVFWPQALSRDLAACMRQQKSLHCFPWVLTYGIGWGFQSLQCYPKDMPALSLMAQFRALFRLPSALPGWVLT